MRLDVILSCRFICRFQSIGRVDLSIEFNRLDRRSRKAQSLRAITTSDALAADALLQGAGERVRVVLQRDHALYG